MWLANGVRTSQCTMTDPHDDDNTLRQHRRVRVLQNYTCQRYYVCSPQQSVCIHGYRPWWPSGQDLGRGAPARA